MILRYRIPLAVLTLVVLTACSVEIKQASDDAEAGATPEPIAETGEGVRGTIRGTEVALTHARLDDQLELSEGEGWAFNPSLLIFLFLNDESPVGRTFSVDPEGGYSGSNAHVHYRWRDPATGEIASEAVMQDYALTLTFGEPEGDRLPGHIRLAIPGKETVVEGAFDALVVK